MGDLRQTIVEVLRFRETAPAAALARFGERDWKRSMHWLDLSGLGLYLYNRLESRDAMGVMPRCVSSALRRNLENNRERNESLLRELQRIAAELASAGVPFCALKGATLTPVACADPGLRHQVDIDLLVERGATGSAQQAVEALGYRHIESSRSTQTFTRKPGFVPLHRDMYRAGGHQALELHSALWDEEANFPVACPSDVVERSQYSRRIGCRVPDPVDAFVYQAVHVMQHLTKYWVRLSWLYEFAHAVEFYRENAAFWKKCRERCTNGNSQAAVAIAIALAERYFAPTICEEARTWQEEELSEPMARWIERYADRCVLRQYPGSKLSLLLTKEFAKPDDWKAIEKKSLYPFHRSHRATMLTAANVLSLQARIRQIRFTTARLSFHVIEYLRYQMARRDWNRMRAAH